MLRLRILTWCSVVCAVVLFFCHRGTPTTIVRGKGLLVDKEWLVNHGAPVTSPEHVRPADQTFLTFPEWFLVFGPAEQAAFFQSHTSTKFPFMTHVWQIWEGYSVVYAQLHDNFPFNMGYHVMIVVIATSSTAEFGFKAVYETLIGRLTDTRDGEELTEEDRFNANFARDYAAFLDTAPWYEFDFKSRLGRLWSETSLFGAHPVRKWERKYILTTELAVKTVYGWLIKLGTKTAYDTPKLKTVVVVNNLPVGIQNRIPDMEILKELSDGSAIITLPRYAPFNPDACALAREGVQFKEIAGNASAILVTVLASQGWSTHSDDYRILFTQPVPSRQGTTRVALATPVPLLHRTLQQLQEQKIVIEHIYDF
jgi:hypothetical protein